MADIRQIASVDVTSFFHFVTKSPAAAIEER
jgi:hypothetical protein